MSRGLSERHLLFFAPAEEKNRHAMPPRLRCHHARFTRCQRCAIQARTVAAPVHAATARSYGTRHARAPTRLPLSLICGLLQRSSSIAPNITTAVADTGSRRPRRDVACRAEILIRYAGDPDSASAPAAFYRARLGLARTAFPRSRHGIRRPTFCRRLCSSSENIGRSAAHTAAEHE